MTNMTQQILTANDLRTGEVVFLTSAHTWSNRFHAAAIIDEKSDIDAIEEAGNLAVAKNIVVGAYFIDITLEDGKPSPVRFREQLRIFGPSTHQQFQKPVHDGVVAA